MLKNSGLFFVFVFVNSSFYKNTWTPNHSHDHMPTANQPNLLTFSIEQ